jgi:protein-L-isoaspartate O-methyltransferase
MELQRRFRLHELTEDPVRWERLIHEEQLLARTESAQRLLLESIYCDADRNAAFNRFYDGLEFRTIVRVLQRLGVPKTSSLCEIGAGPGYLTWALAQAGYGRLALVEPNDLYVTGTGYLSERADAAAIQRFSDLSAWYDDPVRHDTILTHNCIHHFPNISYAAACIRTKMKPSGRWIAIREWYADSASELYNQLASHPYAYKYGVYEFPYSSSYYVQAIEIAGFALEAVIPAGYAGNALAEYVRESAGSSLADAAINLALSHANGLLVGAFKLETLLNRWVHAGVRRFTRPQLMLFRRVEVPEADRLTTSIS